MSIQPHKKESTSKSSLQKEIAVPSKITLPHKPFILKGFSALLLLGLLLFPVTRANAGFFSSISQFFGIGAEAAEDTTLGDGNSQTMRLMEPALTPELKLGASTIDVTIVDDQALESTNMGPLGVSDIEQKYVSTKKIETYTVKSGDTLEKISKQFGISKNTLINSNDSLPAKGSLKVGQVIAILPVEGIAYEVKKGDTIESLARKYNSSAKEILKYNDMENASDLQIGDTIVLPGGKKPVVKVPEEKKTEAPKPTTIEEDIPKATPSAPTVPEKSEATPSSSGFIWPLPLGVGRISQGLHDDNAVDIAAPSGTPIYAIKDGTVLIADGSGWNGGYGKYVVVDFSEGGQALFGHMTRVASSAGQKVMQGDIIGYVGTTGSSTGNHVHLSLRDGIKNPYGKLKKGSTSANF